MSVEQHSSEAGRDAEPGPSANPASTDAPPSIAIPDHELLRCIGRGSYGTVWLARHTMGMYRAVKIVYRQSFKDERPFERELSGIRKFEPISRSHAGFVDVLHVGLSETGGCIYYVMELGDDQVSGQNIDPDHYTPKTLSKEISLRGKLSPEESLRLGLVLCEALGQLHERGLVHRDIKPSNIIYIDGVPKLADIGLVAAIKDAASYVGTEGFIPPEGPGTAQADIFSLGKTLYEASTGRDRQDFPELPSHWDKSADHEKLLELNEVILQACKRDALKRYQSALQMHADLVVAANGRSVRRLKQLERWFATLRRTASLAGLAIVVAAAIGWHFYQQWKVSLAFRERQVGASVAYGTRAMDSGDSAAALSYFADALRLDKADSAREKLHWLRFNSVLNQSPKLVQMWSFPTPMQSVCFSPNGQQVLAVEWQGEAQIFDLATGAPVSPRFGQRYGMRWGIFSPDGKLVVTASEDQSACVWKASDGSIVQRLDHTNRVLCAAFSHDSARLITGCNDKIARIWDTHNWKVGLELSGHTQAILFLGFSRDGRSIVTTSRDGTARIWSATDGHEIASPLPHPNWVFYAAFSPDGKTLVTACADHKARLWDTESSRRIPPDLDHLDGVNSAEFSPDGRLIVTAGLDRIARIWLAENHEPFGSAPILRHSDRLTHASFCPDGRRVVTTCTDGTVRVWDLAGSAVAPRKLHYSISEDKSRFLTITNNKPQVWDTLSKEAVSPLIEPGGVVKQQKLSRNGHLLVTLSVPEAFKGSPRILEVWESKTGGRVGRPLHLTNDLTHVCPNNEGTRLLLYGGHNAQTWNVLAGAPLSPAILHEGIVRSAVLSPDGNQAASWSEGTVQVWDAAMGQPCFAPLKHPFPVTCVQFSRDGSRLVTCGADQTFAKCYAQVWDAKSGQPVGFPMKHGDGVLWASFSHDGSRVVTASEDFTALVWEAATGRQLTSPLRHGGSIQKAEFSTDGKWVVTVSDDKTVRIWSAETGDPLTPPLHHLIKLTDAQFLTDGQEMVSSDVDGNASIWKLRMDKRPIEDCIRLGRLLSGDTITPLAELNAVRSESLASLWKRLRSAYPSEFETSSEETAAWHECMAEVSEHERDWFAASFHLKRLLAIRPGDPLLIERLARLKGYVKGF